MPTWNKNTRQLRIRSSKHEIVRRFAAANAEQLADTYLRLVTAASKARVQPDPTVRQVFDVPRDLWDQLGERAKAEGLTRSEVIEREIALLSAREPA